MSRKNWTDDMLFHRLRTNKSRSTYWDNIRELRKRPSKEVYLKAVQLCHAQSDKDKEIGIDIIAQLDLANRFDQQGTIDIYFKLLQSEQAPRVLESILYGIGHNNKILTEDRVHFLTRFQDHNYSDVRYSLVHALSGLENQSAIETLIKLSRDRHPDVRDWATFALGSQIETNNDAVINPLWERREDDFINVRHEAIAGLANRKDARIKDILIKELDNIDNHGSIILESIESLNDPDFLELLEKQIEKNKISKHINEKWLKDCLETLRSNLERSG